MTGLLVELELLPEEITALKRVAKGQSNIQAAEEEDVDPRTQNARVESACVKLGASNATQAVLLGVRYGIFNLDDLASEAAANYIRLFPNEIEALRLWRSGLDERGIASQLCITYKRVLDRLSSARRKMRVTDNDAAAQKAGELGYF